MNLATQSEPVTDPRALLSHTDALYEVVDDQVKEKRAMGMFSSLVAIRLFTLLQAFVEPHKLGAVFIETLFVLDAARPLKRRPDVAFVSAESWPLNRPVPEIGDGEVVPDLVIEVISPNDVEQDVNQKLKEYFAAGVKQVWHVRPLVQNVTVYRSLKDVKIFTAEDRIEPEDLLPGFRMDLGAIFRATMG